MLKVFISCSIFAVAVIVLLQSSTVQELGQPYTDPVARIRAQDESVHVHAAAQMLSDGDWLTPKVAGRLFLFKPPLLLWCTALAMQVSESSPFNARIAVILFGAGGILAVYWWARADGNSLSGLTAAGLLAANQVWHLFSTLCLTDILCSTLSTLSVMFVALDPDLNHRRSSILAGLCAGGAILAKSIAGVLPIATILVYCLLRLYLGGKIRMRRLADFVAWTLVTILPWHLYQAAVHSHWFMADYIQVQLFGVGIAGATSTVFAKPALTYLTTCYATDPVGTVVVCASLLLLGFARRVPAALQLASLHAAVGVAALFAFRARSFPYVTFVLPPLTVAAVLSWNAFALRLHRPLLLWIPLGLAVASGAVAHWRGLEPAPPLEATRELKQYAGLRRNRELWIAGVDDEFYSMTLRLKRLHYAFADPSGAIWTTIPWHYRYMGIVQSLEEFLHRPEREVIYQRRFLAWGGPSAETVPTLAVLPSAGSIKDLIRARPQSDFFLGEALAPAHLEDFPSHRLWVISAKCRVLLSQSR